MDPYKILNIDRDATPDEIRRAYRKAAKKHHPDMGGEAWIFQQVQEAYESLTNPKVRKKKKRKKKSNPTAKPNQRKKSKRKPNPATKSNQGQGKTELDFSGIDIDLGKSHASKKDQTQARDRKQPKNRFSQKTREQPSESKAFQKEKKISPLLGIRLTVLFPAMVLLFSLAGLVAIVILGRANNDSSASSKSQEKRTAVASSKAGVRGKMLLPSFVSAKDLRICSFYKRVNGGSFLPFSLTKDGEFSHKNLSSIPFTIWSAPIFCTEGYESTV